MTVLIQFCFLGGAGLAGFGGFDPRADVSDSELPDLVSEDGNSDNEEENESSDIPSDELPDLGLAL